MRARLKERRGRRECVRLVGLAEKVRGGFVQRSVEGGAVSVKVGAGADIVEESVVVGESRVCFRDGTRR